MKNFCVVFLALASVCSLFAEIKVSALFGNNMVFQQQKPIRIWGTAKPNSEVKILFNFKYTTTKADDKGAWQTMLPAEKASFKNYALTIFENGIPHVELKNILVGEVWIAGGQSNMEWRVSRADNLELAKSTVLKQKGKYRYFSHSNHTKTPQSEFSSTAKWLVVDDKNVPNLSSVATTFAQELIADLKVPVGIVYMARGGTTMGAWTSDEYMKARPELREKYLEVKKALDAYNKTAYKKRKAEAQKIQDRAHAQKKAGKMMPWSELNAVSRVSPITPFSVAQTPTLWFNGMFKPMRNFCVRGVVWYQGESDADHPRLPFYKPSWYAMTDCWRNQMGDKSLPFVFVQLPSHESKWGDWAKGRFNQFELSKEDKYSYMATCVDLGEEHEIHPKDKTAVAQRLEKIALKYVYGKKHLNVDAPEVKSVSYNNNSAIVNIETFGRGLNLRGDIRGFEVLIDGKWCKALAQLNGNRIVVKSIDGKKVSGVRYLWKSWARPDVCLFNNDGLPLSTFEVK